MNKEILLQHLYEQKLVLVGLITRTMVTAAYLNENDKGVLNDLQQILKVNECMTTKLKEQE